jgi:hypothetical protein
VTRKPAWFQRRCRFVSFRVVYRRAFRAAAGANLRAVDRFVAEFGRGEILALASAARWMCRRNSGRAIARSISASRAQKPKCAAVLAQCFRVYQRLGAYGPRLRATGTCTATASCICSRSPEAIPCDGLTVGSARVALVRERAGSRFPAQETFHEPVPRGRPLGVPMPGRHRSGHAADALRLVKAASPPRGGSGSAVSASSSSNSCTRSLEWAFAST